MSSTCYNRRVLVKTRLILLVLILLLAFALRVYQLDTQSIWYDEGLSIQLAAQDPARAIALSATTDHPPLHTLLLGAWMRLAGDNDFAVRFLSVWCGVLGVALVYALGRLFDWRTGAIAAGFMAIAPLAVYYSQETRGYMLLTVLVLIGTIAAIRLRSGDRRTRIWITYAAAIVAALYTHYFAAFAWVALNLAYLGLDLAGFLRQGISRVTLQKSAKSFAQWVIAQLVILVCFLPWIPNAVAQASSNATYFPGRVAWQTVVGDTWHAFSAGEWSNAALIGWFWLFLIGLGVAYGLAQKMNQDSTQAQKRVKRTPQLHISVVVFSLALILAPLLLMSGLAWLKPKFAPRYLLPSLPAFVTLAALGVTALIDGMRSRYRWWASIGLAVTIVLPIASASSLLSQYNDPALARPDVRSVVQYLTTHAQSSDAIILIGGHQAPAFNHYYRGQSSVIPLPPDLLPAAQSPLDARALTQLQEIARQHPRIWLVLWQDALSDPTHVIVDALVGQGRRLTVGQNFHDIGLMLFDVRDAIFQAAPQHPVDYAFTEPLRLAGYNVDTNRITIDTPLRFGLYLQSEKPISGNYQIYTHLLTPDGTLIAQSDQIAGADSYPTSLWRPGNLLYNRFEIRVPAGTPSGRYHVAVGLYDDRGRLKLSDGRDQIDLFEVTIPP